MTTPKPGYTDRTFNALQEAKSMREAQREAKRKRLLACARANPELALHHLCKRFGTSEPVVRRWLEEAGQSLPQRNKRS